ncbi:MAG: MaoC family dehydratase [Acidimicrobiales bacterium]
MAEVQFDDIDGINALASEEFGEWGNSLEVSQKMINDFAELTGDRQWIHIDVERSLKESPFGGPVAHGFLTLSLMPKLATFPVTIKGNGSAVNYGAEGLRFISPVPAGARVHARSRVVRAEAKPKGTLITTEAEIAAEGSERPALLYKMQVLYTPPR